MAHQAEHLPNDPVLVVIDDGEPEEPLDEWLQVLAADEPTDVDAGAAELIRGIRENGET